MSLDEVAREIYWAAYDQYLGPDYRHPLNFSKEVAWQRCSDMQREFNRHQARRAARALKANVTE